MRHFYLLVQKPHALCAELSKSYYRLFPKSHALCDQLSWSYYRLFKKVPQCGTNLYK